jgi:hypothetical protein
MGPEDDTFMLSGANVSTGYCRMLATAVGEQSRYSNPIPQPYLLTLSPNPIPYCRMLAIAVREQSR